MNHSKLEQLFVLVQQGAKQFKTQQTNGDGRAFWQPTKHLLGQYDIQASSWKTIDAKIVASLLDLSETDEFGVIIEINHFLRQQVRIPTQEEPTLRRIMQVALNSGQFIACDRNASTLANFDYWQTNLHCLSTYLVANDISDISSQLPDSLIEKVKECLAGFHLNLDKFD